MLNWSETLLGALIPAVPVPYTSDGKLDFNAQIEYAKWMKKQPVDGVAVWTSIGRGANINQDTRISILKSWRDILGRERHVVAAVLPAQGVSAEESVKSALKMADDASSFADLLLIYPFSSTGNAPENHRECVKKYLAIAGIGVPFIVSCPLGEFCSEFQESILDEILAFKECAGIRIRSLGMAMVLQDVVTHVRMKHPDKAILAGDNRLLGYSLYRGCHGALAGLASICTVIQRVMLDAWFLGEMERYLELSRLIDHLAEAIYIEPQDGRIRRLLVALAHLKVIPAESAFDPWGPDIPPVHEELVKATVDAINEIVPL